MAEKKKKEADRVKKIEQLPLCLSVNDIAKIMGISRSKAYEVISISGFPVLRLGKGAGGKGKTVIPRDRFFVWLYGDDYEKITREENERERRRTQYQNEQFRLNSYSML